MVNIERLVTDFMIESNRIEGIKGARGVECCATQSFIEGPAPSIADLCALATAYTPAAKLRIAPGMDVRVGDHLPPPGGQKVAQDLSWLLLKIAVMSPHEFHVRYETLHPFMDGNGRTGRALWAWQMVRRAPSKSVLKRVSITGGLYWDSLELGFLHRFYYQALDAPREEDRRFGQPHHGHE